MVLASHFRNLKRRILAQLGVALENSMGSSNLANTYPLHWDLWYPLCNMCRPSIFRQIEHFLHRQLGKRHPSDNRWQLNIDSACVLAKSLRKSCLSLSLKCSMSQQDKPEQDMELLQIDKYNLVGTSSDSPFQPACSRCLLGKECIKSALFSY